MKKVNILLILSVALALASSCNRDEAELMPDLPRAVTITADAAETKTVLDGDGVKWEDGDMIALRFTHPDKEPHVGNFSTSIEGEALASADFSGSLPLEVLNDKSGYEDKVLAVYPHDAVASDGALVFELQASQQARSNGAFASGLNLASAALTLADIRDDGKAAAAFRNALSILRFRVVGDDVTSVTLTGTAPLAGKAPFVTDADGRLVIDETADWEDADKQTSVTLRPADGAECFSQNTVYNLLVLPGTHQSLTATLSFKEYGDYAKTASAAFTFSPSKYYTLNFNADSETLVKEITDKLDVVEPALDDLEAKLATLETQAEKISMLVNRIQSVALMTEYLDNAVYAPFAQGQYNKTKRDIQLDFMVRPAKAAELLLDVCKSSGTLSSVLSAKVDSKNGSLGTLVVKDAVLDSDVMTVTVAPEGISDDFYEGSSSVALALEISDGNTEILSDFANLVPRESVAMILSRTEDFPIMRDATMSTQFNYGVNSANAYSISVTSEGFPADRQPTVSWEGTTNKQYKQGYLYASFKEGDDLSAMSVTLTITSGEDVHSRTITFADGGTFEVNSSGDIDYIGGEVSLEVVSNDFGTWTLGLQDGGGWLAQTNVGVDGRYSADLNKGEARSVSAVFTVKPKSTEGLGNTTYTKTLTLTQKAYGSAIDQTRYYSDGDSKTLRTAVSSYTPLNVVILGDGYKKKDLQKGGKFERSAQSACDAFFGVEPYKSFSDRFNVVMVAYESAAEGPGLDTVTEGHSTYFETYYKGGNDTYVNYTAAGGEKVRNVLRNVLNYDEKAFYRTVVILLVNTSENIGSTNYLSQTTGDVAVTGDGYATCGVAMVSAGTTGTSGLVRHEGGGHGFGRLGDEYADYAVSTVNGKHDVGFYRNIALNTSYWKDFKSAGYGDDKVMYDVQCEGVYRSTHQSGIMWDNTGAFNAVSRHLIYERIIKQTEGAEAYSWEKFLEYDTRNL